MNTEKGFDARDYIFRLKVDEHHREVNSQEEMLKERYPDMVKAEMPYRQEIHKKEPEEEIRKRYPDMNIEDL